MSDNQIKRLEFSKDGDSQIIHNLKANLQTQYCQRIEQEKNIIRNLNNAYPIILIHGAGGNGKSTILYNLILKLINARSNDRENVIKEYSSELDKSINRLSEKIDKIFWFGNKFMGASTTIQDVISEISYSCHISQSTKVTGTTKEQLSKVVDVFDKSRLSIIVIDNFENVHDETLIDFFVKNPPMGFKIVLTSKYNKKYYQDENVFDSQCCLYINEYFTPKLSFEEWKQIFRKKYEQNDSFKEWGDSFDNCANLDRVLKLIYDELSGNIFGMLNIISVIVRKSLFEYDEIEDMLKPQNDGESVYKNAFDRANNEPWNLADEDSRAVMIAAALQVHNTIDLKHLSAISGVNGYINGKLKNNSSLEKAIAKCIDLNLMEKSVVNMKKIYYISNLSRHFIINKLINDELSEYSIIIDKWVESYCEIAKNIGFCYTNTEKMRPFDEPYERDALMFVLDYCFNSGRYDEYICISKNFRYFFYTRSIWNVGEECIHIKRAHAAEIVNKPVEVLEALSYYINIAAKNNQLDNIEQYIERANQICEKNDIDGETLFRYKHSLGLYHYARHDYEKATKLWNEILEKEKMITNVVHDIDAAERWKLKCLRAMSEKNPEEFINMCKERIEEAKEHKFQRSIIDYTLLIGTEFLKQKNFNEALYFLKDVEELIPIVNDSLYNAQFNQCMALCYGETDKGYYYINKAIKYYKALGVNSEIEKFKESVIKSGLFVTLLKSF